MSAEENKLTIRRWVEAAWNKADLSSAESVYAKNYVHHPAGSPDMPGTEGIRQFISAYRLAMPDIHLFIDDMIAEGDSVAWRFTGQGTMTGPLLGIPPTGKRATVTGMALSRFENGKWAEDYTVHDALGMLQQLGVIPKPA